MTDVSSNGVPFEVLGDSDELLRTGIEVEVYDAADPRNYLGVLPYRLNPQFLNQKNATGSGKVVIHASDPIVKANPGLIATRNVLKGKVDGEVRSAFVIQEMDDDYVDKDEALGETSEVSGEGLRTWFNDAIVYPYAGLKKQSGDTRYFNFAAERGSWYKTSDWVTPTRVAKWSIVPNNGSPWNTRPAEWPDAPDAYWVWDRTQNSSSKAPVGFAYFRYEFTTTDAENTDYSIFSAADDQYDLYVDGGIVASVKEKRTAYSVTTRTDFELQPGKHVIGVRVQNNGGYAGLILSLFKAGVVNEAGDLESPALLITYTGIGSVTQQNTLLAAAVNNRDRIKAIYDNIPNDDEHATEKADGLLAYQDAVQTVKNYQSTINQTQYQEGQGNLGWRINAYPASAPGWTPGEVMTTLLSEAAARGVRFPTWLTKTYTNTVDSEGVPWPRLLDWSFGIGTKYTDVVEKLEEVACDVVIEPDDYRLQMYAEQGTHRTVQSTALQPVMLEAGKNVLKAGDKTVGNLLNALMLKTEDGYAQQTSTNSSISKWGRIEDFLSTDSSDALSADVANAVFKTRAQPQNSATYEITDLDNARPYVDFFVGDWVLAPTSDGTIVERQVMSITFTEDAKTGEPGWTLEFDTIYDELIKRYDRWLSTAADGTLGGSVANTGGGGGANTTVISGPKNASGFQGAPGTPGLKWRGDWLSTSGYVQNDAVRYQGQTWIALAQNTNSAPSASNSSWGVLAGKGDKGDKGDPGAAFNWRGTWDSTVTYATNDGVTYQGSSYVAWKASTGQNPNLDASSWLLFAKQGDQGPQGNSIKGDKGDPGKSAYQSAVDAGYTGTVNQWLASLIGPQGPGFVYLGNWATGIGYDIGQVVYYAGELWVAMAKNQDSIPSRGNSNWEPFNLDVANLFPTGGSKGQVLTKKSGSDNDFEWTTVVAGQATFPPGGTLGMALVKASNDDNDVKWAKVSGLPSGGTTGQTIVKKSNVDGDVAWGDAAGGGADISEAFRGAWKAGIDYKQGDLVYSGDSLYVATQDIISGTLPPTFVAYVAKHGSANENVSLDTPTSVQVGDYELLFAYSYATNSQAPLSGTWDSLIDVYTPSNQGSQVHLQVYGRVVPNLAAVQLTTYGDHHGAARRFYRNATFDQVTGQLGGSSVTNSYSATGLQVAAWVNYTNGAGPSQPSGLDHWQGWATPGTYVDGVSGDYQANGTMPSFQIGYGNATNWATFSLKSADNGEEFNVSAGWERVSAWSVPVGGTPGQVLTKKSGLDGDAVWQDPAGGGALIPLVPGVEASYSVVSNGQSALSGSLNITGNTSMVMAVAFARTQAATFSDGWSVIGTTDLVSGSLNQRMYLLKWNGALGSNGVALEISQGGSDRMALTILALSGAADVAFNGTTTDETTSGNTLTATKADDDGYMLWALQEVYFGATSWTSAEGLPYYGVKATSGSDALPRLAVFFDGASAGSRSFGLDINGTAQPFQPPTTIAKIKITPAQVDPTRTRVLSRANTPSLAVGDTWTGTMLLGSGYRLYKIETSRPARVRLYDTTTHRSSDAGRAIGYDPTGDHGLMFEFVSTTTLLAATLSPMVEGMSFAVPVSDNIPVAITNIGTSAGAISVTLTYMKTE